MGCDEGEDAQPQAAWELKTARWCWSCACTVPAQPVPNLGAAGAVLGLFRGANPEGEKNLKLRKEYYNMVMSGISMGVSKIVKKISIWAV